QWDAPAGKQVVAIANGDLWYRTGFTYATAFTQVVSGLFSTTKPTFFQPFRANASGAPLILFIASDSKFFKWYGTTLTRIDPVAGTPDADRVIAYHTRLFSRDPLYKKNLFWSKVGDGEAWTSTGIGTDGGSALVDG